jgi:pyruvate dehydrogenase E1 component alpha subunit
VVAVWRAVAWACQRARAGRGPTLVEAVTVRWGPHTNNDDPSRYRPELDEQELRGRDPVAAAQAHLHEQGVFDDRLRTDAAAQADRMSEDVRDARAHGLDVPDSRALFAHVYVDAEGHFDQLPPLVGTRERGRPPGTEHGDAGP